jgi:hypothetical protein
MNQDPSNHLHRRYNERNNINDDYHERFHLNQFYNAVEDEQIYMDEYTTLLHRYNEFIVNGNAMFTRMEQTLRENLTRTLVRQSFYYHHSNEMHRATATQQPQSPAPLNSMVTPTPTPAPAPAPAPAPRSEPPPPTINHNRNNNSPQPQLPSQTRFGDGLTRLLSRYLTGDLNRQGREINNGRENLFSMLYTGPVAFRTTLNGGGGGAAAAVAPVAPTNDQINRATLNTVFSNIISPVNATCPISRDEFNDESEITMIRGCNHIFNRASLIRWFANNSTCPLCRHDIRNYRPSQSNTESQRNVELNNMSNISIDRVDDDHITFSYDIPVQYNDDDIYRNIVNTITGMAQNSQQNNNHDYHNNNDDDIMDVD